MHSELGQASEGAPQPHRGFIPDIRNGTTHSRPVTGGIDLTRQEDVHDALNIDDIHCPVAADVRPPHEVGSSLDAQEHIHTQLDIEHIHPTVKVEILFLGTVGWGLSDRRGRGRHRRRGRGGSGCAG